MSKVKHVITNKEESFCRKGLASIIANTVNIMKRCYSRITNTKSKDATSGQLMQQTWLKKKKSATAGWLNTTNIIYNQIYLQSKSSIRSSHRIK